MTSNTPVYKQLFEKAQQELEEERRKREDADRSAASARPQKASDFLESCHNLYRQIRPVVDNSSATTGTTTDPVRRLFPQRITPWTDFEQLQRDEWDRLERQGGFWNNEQYPSSAVLD